MQDQGLALFSHFIVVRLISPNKQSKETGPEARLRMCIAAPGHSVDTIPKDLLRFCFPDLGDFSYAPNLVSESFTTVLTNESGGRMYGFCRRHIQPSKKKKASSTSKQPLECLCILTKHPMFQVFSNLMMQIQMRWLIEPKSVPPFLQEFLKQSLPPPNTNILITLKGNSSTVEKFWFLRYKLDHLSVPTDPLFKYLSVDNAMCLMAALLCERRVIMQSNSLTKLSQCIHAAMALLFPFKWQHIFIPVLPNSMLHYVCAPMPFLVGVRSCDMKKVLSLPVESVVLVKLDDDALQVFKGPVDLIPFPTISGSKLRSRLTSLSAQGALSDKLKKGFQTIMGKGTDIDRVLLSDSIHYAWISFFLVLFSNWRRYVDKSTGVVGFNFERYLDDARARSEDDFAFAQCLRQSQLFQVFTQERIADAKCHSSSDATEFGILCSTVRADSETSFSTIIDAVKAALEPPKSGRFAAVALDVTSSTSAYNNVDETGLLVKLCNATFASQGLNEIMAVIWHRLEDSSGRDWRHAAFGLRILNQLALNGSDSVLCECRDNMNILLTCMNYMHKENEIQATIQSSADDLIRSTLNFSSQAQMRLPRFAVVGESNKPYRIDAPVAEVVDIDPEFSQEYQDHMMSKCASLHRRSQSFEEFPSRELIRLIEISSLQWSKYLNKSVVQGRARVIPKFSKLKKKMCPEGMSDLGCNSSTNLTEAADLLRSDHADLLNNVTADLYGSNDSSIGIGQSSASTQNLFSLTEKSDPLAFMSFDPLLNENAPSIPRKNSLSPFSDDQTQAALFDFNLFEATTSAIQPAMQAQTGPVSNPNRLQSQQKQTPFDPFAGLF